MRWMGLIAVLGLLSACGRARAAEDLSKVGISPTPPTSGVVVKVGKMHLAPYKLKIPGSDVSFEMMPIPGGQFKMGSPAKEKDRSKDEGPQIDVEVQPFWMGKHEVTWAEYRLYMLLDGSFRDLRSLRRVMEPPDAGSAVFEKHKAMREKLVKQLAAPRFAALREHLRTKLDKMDALSAPTELYDPATTYQNGDGGDLPAVTMTQFAARQYTKWLSAITGHAYRLPTEAEWEYACRANSTTAYHCGDDPKTLREFAWFHENADEKTHPVGKKKPNAWGLHDMHGNVGEWVLDQHHPDWYRKFAEKTTQARDLVAWPTVLFPRVIRGGSYDDDPDKLRSAARGRSNDKEWKLTDPDSPPSPWWFTESPTLGIGFRIVRVPGPLTAEERKACYDADHAAIKEDLETAIDVRNRGVRDLSGKSLPEVTKQLAELIKLREAEMQGESN